MTCVRSSSERLSSDYHAGEPRRAGAASHPGFPRGEKVLDTTCALYVWEWPNYPQYYIPLADVNADALATTGTHPSDRTRDRQATRSAGRRGRSAAAAHAVHRRSALEPLAGTVRFEWAALDAWFEEDEQVFVHPRNPYARVDAIRSNRPVRVELDGVVLAESASPVMVFETGLPTRYYVSRTDVCFAHLLPTDTVTSCPYKGTTSGYWSVLLGGTVHTRPRVGVRLSHPPAPADQRA